MESVIIESDFLHPGPECFLRSTFGPHLIRQATSPFRRTCPRFPLLEKYAAASPARDADVRFSCFAGPVYHAAHDSDLQRGSDPGERLFDFSSKSDQVYFGPGACGAGDYLNAPAAEAQGPQNRVCDPDLLDQGKQSGRPELCHRFLRPGECLFPRPILSAPGRSVPASVMPTWRG